MQISWGYFTTNQSIMNDHHHQRFWSPPKMASRRPFWIFKTSFEQKINLTISLSFPFLFSSEFRLGVLNNPTFYRIRKKFSPLSAGQRKDWKSDHELSKCSNFHLLLPASSPYQVPGFNLSPKLIIIQHSLFFFIPKPKPFFWIRKMSVVGLDFGNQNAVIAAAGRGGVDVILNGNSNRLNA